MTITEPATLVTDYLLAVFTGVLARRLFHAAREHDSGTQWWWAIAFAATAIAGIAGGTVHGFRTSLHPMVTAAIWLVAIESLIVAAFAVVRGTLLDAGMDARLTRSLSLAIAAAYAAYGLWVAGTPRFIFAIAAYGAALGVLAAFKISSWNTEREAGRWMIAGVAVSVIAAIVQQSGWSLHRHFNHNDLYHVIQACGVWLLYRGAMLSRERASRSFEAAG